MNRLRLPALALLILACVLADGPAAVRAQDGPPAPARRVVVFGIDGADAGVFERLLKEGKLPHFRALADRGCWGPLATSNPAQSPVSWAQFLTGSNPGKTGIFDFIRRNPESPGKLEIGLVGRTWTTRGLPPRSVVAAAPALIGLLAGVLAWLLAVLVGRMAGASVRSRRLAGTILGLLAAGGAGAGAHRVVRWIPDRVPAAVNLRGGTPLSVVLGRADVPATFLLAPMSFPADQEKNLRVLTGLGTPDVQATWGFYTVFTDEIRDPVEAETGGYLFHLPFGDGDRAVTRAYGPEDFTRSPAERAVVDLAARESSLLWDRAPGVPSAKRLLERRAKHASLAARVSCLVEVTRDLAAKRATVRVGRGGPRPVLDLPLPAPAEGDVALPAAGDGSVTWGPPMVLSEGAWSGRVEFEFRLNPLLPPVKALGRFLLESVGGPGGKFRLLLTPLQIDPRSPPPGIGLSWPEEYAPSLAAKVGLYDTLGWPCMTNPVKDDLLSDEAFMQQVRALVEEQRAMILAELREPDWRVFFTLVSAVDRVQHVMWRHTDPLSPTYDPAEATRHGGAVEEIYVSMDFLLGDIVATAGEGTEVVVLSDHGFAPFRRGVNLNNFLLDKGFQTNASAGGGPGDDRTVAQLFSGRDFFDRVDWAKTKAYAVGLGGIFINLAGREKDGSVPATQYDAVVADISAALLALRDGDRPVVRAVYPGRAIYAGPFAQKYAPDLVVGFERGYRVSWQTTLGGGGRTTIEDNLFRWSGDHCSVDPSLVPGILVSSLPLQLNGAAVIDVAPTILDLVGVAVPEEWDGKSLVGK